MKKKVSFFIFIMLVFSVLVFATEGNQAAHPGKSPDLFSLIIAMGYLLGVFILLPIVIYTNLKEKLFVATAGNQGEVQLVEGLSEQERNERAAEILEKIEEKLTPYQAEDGTNMITITNGAQARFMKRGLDYINKRLLPTDAGILDRVREFAGVYEQRTRRVFTGSNWIIVCSAGVALLAILTGGIGKFLVIHLLGLLFYILSSRTTMYGVEKRMKHFGAISIGVVGSIMTALFLGDGTKYYVRENGGPWRRDWETEGQMALMGLLLLIIVAVILGFLAALLGVINFVINYSTSFLLPFKSDDKWYEEKFGKKVMA
jgi:hypothetical protein